MQINLRPSNDPVSIRWMRPGSQAVEAILREQNAPILPLPTPWCFNRAEWALLVTSGLVHALGGPHGWQDWDDATHLRPSGVNERDCLLSVAALFLQGPTWPQGGDRARRAFERLAERATQYRATEGNESILPWPRVVFSHAGRLLPDPSFQAPALEHMVEETHIDTLVDLAKHGEEITFKDLAQTLGVPAEKLNELWAGTVRRVR